MTYPWPTHLTNDFPNDLMIGVRSVNVRVVLPFGLAKQWHSDHHYHLSFIIVRQEHTGLYLHRPQKLMKIVSFKKNKNKNKKSETFPKKLGVRCRRCPRRWLETGTV